MAVVQMAILVLLNISVLSIKLYIMFSLFTEDSLQSYCVIQELKLLLTNGARIGNWLALVERCKVTLEGGGYSFQLSPT